MNHLVGKTVKTKAGDEVEIIAVRSELEQPIVGILRLIESDVFEQKSCLESWYGNGQYQYGCGSLMDLVLE